jgi:hypothetical protein
MSLPSDWYLEQYSSRRIHVMSPGDVGSTEPEMMMVVTAPETLDANHDEVPASLSIDGSDVVFHVDHTGPGVAYPVLADPAFYTKGDRVHISSSPPRAASGHGWWLVGDCKCLSSHTATVTVKIQYRTTTSQSWQTVQTKVKTGVKPGGGSSRRATAREQCSNSNGGLWRSIIDVDVNAYADPPDKTYTSQVGLQCRP